MTDLVREDLKGTSVDLTFKPMPSGEQRFRMRPKTGLYTSSVILTVADPIQDDGSYPGWQQAHSHKGTIEFYSVIYGQIGIVRVTQNGVIGYVVEAGENTQCFKLGDVHNILPGASAEFLTWQTIDEEGVGNPERQGNDYWPAGDSFDSEAEKAMKKVEKLMWV